MSSNSEQGCWYANECIEFDDKLLGELPQALVQHIKDVWTAKGWLSQNGVCVFPMDVQAHPSGVITKYPIKWWATASDAEIWEAINSGVVLFVDGNGKKYTLAAYRATYPNYPNPLYVLKMAKRFPPNPDSYLDLSDKEVQKEWTKIIFRPMM
jgi:hypothetical protein